MNKIIKVLLSVSFTLFFSLPFAPKVFAQVVINEVSSASDPEWVEIYNISSDSASLKNYSINFGSDSQNKFFCDTENISGNAYKIISLSSHWLADGGDTVTFKNGDDAVDSIAYGTGHTLKSPTSTGSISRSPDGSSNWILLTASTQQGDIVSFDCPTPTPTTSPSPSPSPSSTPTLTPTPTRTPTPIASPKPSAKAGIPTPTPTGSPEVLGIETISTTPTPLPLQSPNIESKPPVLAFVLIGTGMIFIGASAYLGFRSIKSSRKQNDI
jgi:hypothetical protein